MGIELHNAYDIRNEIKALGGKFQGGSKAWVVTEDQLAKLVERANESYRRSNNRDRALGVAFAGVRIVREDETEQMGRDLLPTDEQLEAEAAAARARYS